MRYRNLIIQKIILLLVWIIFILVQICREESKIKCIVNKVAKKIKYWKLIRWNVNDTQSHNKFTRDLHKMGNE